MAGAKWISFVQRETAKAVNRLRGAVNKTAQAVVNQAKRNASGRPGPKVGKTGHLRQSIRAERATGKRLEATVLAGGKLDVDYAVYVEFGTSRAPAYPYLQPAVESQRAKHFDRLRLAVGEEAGFINVTEF